MINSTSTEHVFHQKKKKCVRFNLELNHIIEIFEEEEKISKNLFYQIGEFHKKLKSFKLKEKNVLLLLKNNKNLTQTEKLESENFEGKGVSKQTDNNSNSIDDTERREFEIYDSEFYGAKSLENVKNNEEENVPNLEKVSSMSSDNESIDSALEEESNNIEDYYKNVVFVEKELLVPCRTSSNVGIEVTAVQLVAPCRKSSFQHNLDFSLYKF
ncbi:hypothetical protein HDU92_007317 [Lobulomyces angularis]|nr:hypothetical protein HDU92_007317 [Lobulomyces angularis]